MPNLSIILTCDGGSGHKSAAEALQKKALAAGDTASVTNTTSESWHKTFIVDFGKTSMRWWDWSQRTGNTEFTSALASLRHTSQLFYYVYKNKVRKLIESHTDIDTYDDVIFHNTQPNNLGALITTIAEYNREVMRHNQNHPENPRKKVKLHSHFTDCPTQYAKMYIEEMGRINVDDLDDAQFLLHSPSPVAEHNLFHGETPEKAMKALFPKLYHDNKRTRVIFTDGPIRPEFIHYKNNPALKKDGVNIMFSNQAEFNALSETLNGTFQTFNEQKSTATLAFQEKDTIASIMLGSQASIEGTLKLIEKEIETSKQTDGIQYVFAFCGANKPEEGLVLYGKVLEKAKAINSNPNSRIKIIPLTNQPASMIANLYSLANRVVIRPGGISIMEIVAVVQKGKIFIYTEIGKFNEWLNWLLGTSAQSLEHKYSQQDPNMRLADLIAWEPGNALHAQDHCIDENERTRVTPMNQYTYANELAFDFTKDELIELTKAGKYNEVFEKLNAFSRLHRFMLSGYDITADLAHLVQADQLYNLINQEASELMQRDKVLELMLTDLTELVKQFRTENLERLKTGKDTPSEILKETQHQLIKVQEELRKGIEAIKQSNIKNKGAFIKILEIMSRAVANFFRMIFGFKPVHSPTTVLKKLDNDVTKTINAFGLFSDNKAKRAASKTGLLLTDGAPTPAA